MGRRSPPPKSASRISETTNSVPSRSIAPRFGVGPEKSSGNAHATAIRPRMTHRRTVETTIRRRRDIEKVGYRNSIILLLAAFLVVKTLKIIGKKSQIHPQKFGTGKKRNPFEIFQRGAPVFPLRNRDILTRGSIEDSCSSSAKMDSRRSPRAMT